MVSVDKQIVLTALSCLTVIYLALIFSGNNDEVIGAGIVAIIAAAGGVVIPRPKINNRTGVLKW